MIIINCLFGTLYKSFESFSKVNNSSGVSVWNVRETGGQESHCPGHENVTFVEIWSFLAERLS